MYVRTLHSTSWHLSTMAPSNTPARPSPCAWGPPGRTEDRYTNQSHHPSSQRCLSRGRPSRY